MALTLEEKLELQVAIMQDLEQLDNIDDIAERFAVQLRIKENLDKLEADSPEIQQEEAAETERTDYQRLQEGEFMDKRPADFFRIVKSACEKEHARLVEAGEDAPGHASELSMPLLLDYLNRHYVAATDSYSESLQAA